jgi:hypothetical protein
MNLTLPAWGKSFHLIQAAGLGPGDQRALPELQNRGESEPVKIWSRNPNYKLFTTPPRPEV